MPDSAQIILNLFDGSRRPLDSRVSWMARLMDGQPASQRQTHTFDGLHGSTQPFRVPYFDNAIFDAYTVVVSPDGYQDGAWMPVHLSPNGPAEVDLMVVPKDEELNFHDARWQDLKDQRPSLVRFITNSAGDDQLAGQQYATLLENRPEPLAAFLNIMTALREIRFPSGRGVLDYYWNVAWPGGDPRAGGWLDQVDNRFKADRFFCYVDSAILTEFPEAVKRGMFDQEPDPSRWDHAGATESYKQTQYDVANVQLTFHGHDTATFLATNPDRSQREVSCVKIEPDIDYHRDLAAHILLEYIPHKLTGGVTDPKVAYMLRWTAARAAGRDFDPLFTIQSAAAIRAATA